jgi:hypothetical protein
MLEELGAEGGVGALPVQRQLLGEAHRQRLAGLELPLGLGLVDLGDRLFVESFTRSLRVAGEQSGVALVERRHLEPRQLLDARGGHAGGVARAEEGEEAGEVLGDQLLEVQRLVLVHA